MRAAGELTAERSSTVPLRVDYVTENRAEPAQTVYCTDIEGTELRVAVPEPTTVNPQLETGQWHQFDGVMQAKSHKAELLYPPGDRSAARIDAPEGRTTSPPAERSDPWLVQLAASEERIGITVQPRPTDGVGGIRADDPETFEIGAVCLAHCDGTGDTTVYHREESATRDEHLLLEHVVEDLSETEGATLLTSGNDYRPLELLYQRLAAAGKGDIVATGAERVLEECFHADAERVAVRTGADTLVEAAQQLGIGTGPVRLDDYDTELHPADWREDRAMETSPLSDVSDPRMSDRDYSALVERYLRAEDELADSEQLARCLKAYASADLDLLRELATEDTVARLGCPQLSGRLPSRGRSG